jgi:CheY-like chemotaxis protein
MPTIMVVDDNPEIRELLSLLLSANGYDVIESNGGSDCMERLKSGEKPDLILLDVMMPDLDGWAVSNKIKTNRDLKDILICVLTAKNTDMDATMSLEYGHADWHLNKPISKKDLIDTVDWLICQKPVEDSQPLESVSDPENDDGSKSSEGLEGEINPKLMKHSYDFL